MKSKNASSLVDYVLVFVVVVAVIVGMGVYVQRTLMGKYKETGDAFSHGRQYANASSNR